jgi:hypothetical protein
MYVYLLLATMTIQTFCSQLGVLGLICAQCDVIIIMVQVYYYHGAGRFSLVLIFL